MNRRKSFDPGRLIIIVLLMALAVSTIFPFIWMASTSVKSMGEILGSPQRLLPVHYDFSTYTKIWSEVPFGRYFVNSLVFSCSVVIIALFLNSLAGYAFARLQFKGRGLLFILILCTMMIPFQVTMTPLFLIIYKLGMIDTYQGLIIPRAADAFGIFMMRQFFLTLPRDLEESGRIDGASEFRIFFQIMLPLCKPAFVTLGVFIFMGNWNDLLYPLLMTNSEKFRPIQAAIALFAGKYGTDYSFVLTGLLLASIPTLVAYLFAQRFFVSGIAMTGIK